MSLFSRVTPPSTRLIGSVAGRLSRVTRGTPRTGRARKGQAGQALPLFVLMIFVLTGSVAVVTDVSWFWVNQQKMQRAADAGALAGAVFLPGDPSGAYAAARAATARNGYTDGVGGVLVTPAQEAQNRRRLDVSVAGPIGTYFARVFGMNQVAGSAQSKAEFTLPVPMGSPQNYYGVGDVTKNNITTNTTQPQANQRVSAASVPSGGSWTAPANAYGAGLASSTTTNGAAQQWSGFSFSSLPNDPTLVIEAITLRLDGADLNGGGTVTSCQLQTDLSWGAGANGTWTSIQNSPDLSISPISVAVGSTTTMTNWGAHAWTYSNLSSTNFRVRLTWVNGPTGTSACPNTRYLDLDEVDAQVYWHTSTTTTTTTPGTGTVPNPTGGTLSSQGFWGAIITSGGSRENGDEFSPIKDNLRGIPTAKLNPEHDTLGYDYAVILPGGSGQVRIYDATFCETGGNGAGGNMGAGDHWIGGSPNGVTTVFSLWNENGTPYDTSNDTLVHSSTQDNLFKDQVQADYSGVMGTPAHAGLADCASDRNHNAWYTLATGVPAGRYRLNVNTSSTSNDGTNAENMWSAWVSSSGTNPQIYGEARMAAYNNLPAGTQKFYLAQIDASNAGKTMEISLFDPGDVSGDAYLRILSPNGNAYNYATFSWTADNGATPGVNVTQIQTAATSGGSRFQDALITIDIVLPNTYGTTGLTPPGEPSAGWWKIEYSVNGGNDTTTWQVAIKGSPVHLVR